MIKIGPCKGCPDRKPACHDKCEKFIEYREYLDRINQKRHEADTARSYIWDGIIRRQQKESRHKK